MTAIVEFDPLGAEAIKGALGPEASVLPSLDALKAHLDVNMFEDCIVLGPSIDQVDVFSLAEELRVTRPSLGVVMVRIGAPRDLDITLYQGNPMAYKRDLGAYISPRDLTQLFSKA